MPASLQNLQLESSGAPDLSPAFNVTGRGWTDTSQASRLRMNTTGDKDGTPITTKVVNVASGFTGTILVAQFVSAQSFSPRGGGGAGQFMYCRATIQCLQSATGVNATATAGLCIVQPPSGQLAQTLRASDSNSVLATTVTNRFFFDNSISPVTATVTGNICLEVGVSIAASTVAGTVTLYFGSAATTNVVVNQTNTAINVNPFFYTDPDLTVKDNQNLSRMRAENDIAANVGW